MMPAMNRLLLLLAAQVVLACGGGPAADDDPIDAGLPDAVCPTPEGRAFIMQELRILPPDQGRDLDGDGDVDNELGNFPPSHLETAHQGMDTSINTGELTVLTLVTNWDPPVPDDPDIGLHFFAGYDGDIPTNPSNNFTGDGEFYVRLDHFDLNCQSRTQAEEATMVGGVLTATRSAWAFPLTTGTGTLRMDDAQMVVTFDDEYRTHATLLTGVFTYCALAALPFPGETPGTVLDAMVNDPALLAAFQVDMDRDGDGYEQVIGDGLTVLKCVDPEEGEIYGRECPCHPAIVDGFSAALSIQGILARVIGLM